MMIHRWRRQRRRRELMRICVRWMSTEGFQSSLRAAQTRSVSLPPTRVPPPPTAPPFIHIFPLLSPSSSSLCTAGTFLSHHLVPSPLSPYYPVLLPSFDILFSFHFSRVPLSVISFPHLRQRSISLTPAFPKRSPRRQQARVSGLQRSPELTSPLSTAYPPTRFPSSHPASLPQR